MARKLTQEEFIEQITKIHLNNIDFSESLYVNDSTKIKCKCNKCGNVWFSTPNNLKGSPKRKPKGCPRCAHGSAKYSLEEWKNMAHEIYGDKYDLSLINEYNGRNTYVNVICKKHGVFSIKAGHFLSGHECKQCSIENRKKPKKSFEKIVEESINVHGEKYKYHEDTYINSLLPMKISCPIHGDFLQTPHKHISSKQGCPKCNQSHLETEIENFLINNSIKIEQQKHFSWLGLQSIDFYLPDYNVAIECQGGQHYKSVDFFGGSEGYKQTIERDQRKKQLCEENGVELLYFTHYNNINEEGNIYKDKDKLLEKIKTKKCL